MIRIGVTALVVLFAVTPLHAQTSSVAAPRLTYLERNAAYDFFLPILVKVRASDVRRFGSDVQVRLFPNKTLDQLRTSSTGVTADGCRILASRVNDYRPSFIDPDIRLTEIYETDLRCANGYLAATPFVAVVESSDNIDPRFLRIKPQVVAAYLRNAYTFTVQPPRRACGGPGRMASRTSSAKKRIARDGPPRALPAAAPASAPVHVSISDHPGTPTVSDVDAPDTSCIESVRPTLRPPE